MKVELVRYDNLDMTDMAIGECYDKKSYCDTEKRNNRIKKVALQHKHSSVLEFTNFVFQIEASTKVLLEMTRHRMANYACKSSRYTLNKSELIFESTGDSTIDNMLEQWRQLILAQVKQGKSNELTSLMLPQAYQYRWVVQFNARSLINFFELRRANSAHFHIREIANMMYESIPSEMKYLFEGTE